MARPKHQHSYIVPAGIGYYLLWIALHYAAANLYVYFCTPTTLYGVLTSPFMVATPHCSALRWMISEGSNTVLTMWSLGGVWIMSRIVRPR